MTTSPAPQAPFDYWYGFPHANYTEERLKIVSDYCNHLQEKESHWKPYFKSDSEFPKPAQTNRFKSLVRKGIPPKLRPIVWKGLLDVQSVYKPGLYQNYLTTHESSTSTALHDIEADLNRTFPEHPLFHEDETINRLRRILSAYSWHNPELGYCQSLNCIAGMLILVYSDDEDAFWVLVQIINLLPNYHGKTMRDLRIDLKVMDHYLRKHVPDFHALLSKFSFTAEHICMEWFLTLFGRDFPAEFSFRVWDVLFNEGWKTLFRVSLGICTKAIPTLRSQPSASPIAVMRQFCLPLVEIDSVFDLGFQVRSFSRKGINQQRENATKIVEQEDAETARRR
ncbi:putative TBC1 domain family member 2A [Blattamonas nauphoetae]|uniref:TBC1 domain family member 2A n=1 Tax=Blattamonas nauphoetae TaxID=2049346 RepID=A0ABQ9Y4Y5_9EUKA|nr:putative TBC1 domain family member 2A [Blattamonas nauphoetae]